MTINKIQEFCIHLFLINRLVNHKIFLINFFLKTAFNTEFSYIEIWFTDENSKPLEIEDKINISLVIN